jgi:hypothetical protein
LLENLGEDDARVLKMGLHQTGVRLCELDSSASVWDPVTGPCITAMSVRVLQKGGEFLEHGNNYQQAPCLVELVICCINFIYLFNDAVGISDYMVSNGKVISK